MDLQTSPAGRTDKRINHHDDDIYRCESRSLRCTPACSTMAVAATTARSDNDDDGRQEASGTLHTPPSLAAGTRRFVHLARGQPVRANLILLTS